MMQHQQLNQRKYKFVAPQNFFKSQSDILMTSPITSPAFLELQRLLNLNFDASNRIYHRRRICITYIQHLQTEMKKCQEKKTKIHLSMRKSIHSFIFWGLVLVIKWVSTVNKFLQANDRQQHVENWKTTCWPPCLSLDLPMSLSVCKGGFV